LSKVVIADTGPIIAFARLKQLALLPKIFEHIYITDAVVAECLAGRDVDEIARIRVAIDNEFECVSAPDYSDFLFEIDEGEASAISTAVERGCGLLIDDKAGRKLAGNLGVPVIGTLGVLVICRRKQLIPGIRPLIDELVTSGYFLGDNIVAAALAACGE